MKVVILLAIVATAMAAPTSFVRTFPSSFGFGGVFPSMYKGGDANTQFISNPTPFTYSHVAPAAVAPFITNSHAIPSIYNVPSGLTHSAQGIPSIYNVPSGLTFSASGLPSVYNVPSGLTYSASALPSVAFNQLAAVPKTIAETPGSRFVTFE